MSTGPATAAFRLCLDPLGFVRRVCPRCRRAFRTRPAPEDGAAVQSCLGEQLAHAGMGAPEPTAHCPYCGRGSPRSAFFTPAQREALGRLARSLGEHVRFDQLRWASQRQQGARGPTYWPVPPAPLPTATPPEPAEPTEPRGTPCCGEELRLKVGWTGQVICPRCGLRPGRGLSRPRAPGRAD